MCVVLEIEKLLLKAPVCSQNAEPAVSQNGDVVKRFVIAHMACVSYMFLSQCLPHYVLDETASYKTSTLLYIFPDDGHLIYCYLLPQYSVM